ncbi:MAG: hypothetical protein B6I36_00275 [Desulfobacteraceae bacterium 4572_35.1]|nr:MAG: hypothetical protein B6I36_00275 [Desulfobacteraceae bacterium 4572_35.1]
MMDYFFLQAMVCQLRTELQGALLNKVFQPQRNILILRFWNGRIQQRLLLGIDDAGPRMYITDESYRNPLRPPRFCQLLRSRLHRLLHFDIDAADRVVKLSFVGKNGEQYTLVAEMFKRGGNIILLDSEQQVVDSLHRSTPNDSRQIIVGQLYAPVPIPGEITLPDAADNIPDHGDSAEWLTSKVVPMSRVVAMNLKEQHDGLSLSDRVRKFVTSWQNGHLHPCKRGSILTMCVDQILMGEDLSQVARQHYAELADVTRSDGNIELHKAVKSGLKKLHKRLEKIDQQIEKCLLADDERQKGDLLLANLHQMRRGMDKITVMDYYSDPPVPLVIVLDPAKTPNDNAQACFKRYRKGSRGLEHCERRQQQTNYEIEWLEQIGQQLKDADSGADCDIIRQELIDGHWYRPKTAIQRDTRAINPSTLINHGKTPGGWEILWGGNNKTNDFITKNQLKDNDLWFHIHNMPGCHLILKSGGADVENVDIIYAAKIAAQHSKAKHERKAEVMVTDGKWVQRIKGAPLGLVKVKKYRVVTVMLDK